MQWKQGWKLDESGFRKKKKKPPEQQRQLFMRYHHSQPKTGVGGGGGGEPSGKAEWKKRQQKQWRSKNAHDKEAHSNKIKWPTSSATANWSKN